MKLRILSLPPYRLGKVGRRFGKVGRRLRIIHALRRPCFKQLSALGSHCEKKHPSISPWKVGDWIITTGRKTLIFKGGWVGILHKNHVDNRVVWQKNRSQYFFQFDFFSFLVLFMRFGFGFTEANWPRYGTKLIELLRLRLGKTPNFLQILKKD